MVLMVSSLIQMTRRGWQIEWNVSCECLGCQREWEKSRKRSLVPTQHAEPLRSSYRSPRGAAGSIPHLPQRRITKDEPHRNQWGKHRKEYENRWDFPAPSAPGESARAYVPREQHDSPHEDKQTRRGHVRTVIQ